MSALAVFFCSGQAVSQTEQPAWMPVISQLASALSQNNVSEALGAFDSAMKDYGEIESGLSALTAQADILCAIDVIDDKEENGVRALDVDWYMQLKSQSDAAIAERRRERVRVEMRQIRGKWKIVSLTPLSIIGPIRIQ